MLQEVLPDFLKSWVIFSIYRSYAVEVDGVPSYLLNPTQSLGLCSPYGQGRRFPVSRSEGFEEVSPNTCGPCSVVGIATAYGLDGPGIESRWEARFSAPVQTGPEAHPASCKMGTVPFPGVRCGRGVTLTPHPLLVPRSKID